MAYFVYLLASDVNGTLYVGVTNDLVRRVHEHRTDAVPGSPYVMASTGLSGLTVRHP